MFSFPGWQSIRAIFKIVISTDALFKKILIWKNKKNFRRNKKIIPHHKQKQNPYLSSGQTLHKYSMEKSKKAKPPLNLNWFEKPSKRLMTYFKNFI